MLRRSALPTTSDIGEGTVTSKQLYSPTKSIDGGCRGIVPHPVFSFVKIDREPIQERTDAAAITLDMRRAHLRITIAVATERGSNTAIAHRATSPERSVPAPSRGTQRHTHQ